MRPSTILAPRRLTVFLLLLVVGASLATAATLDHDTAAPSPVLALPQMAPGDAGRYAGMDGRPLLDFRVTGPSVMHDAAGQPRTVLTVAVHLPSDHHFDGREKGASETSAGFTTEWMEYHVAALDHTVIAATEARVWDIDGDAERDADQWDQIRVSFEHFEGDLPCGFVNRMQGAEVTPDPGGLYQIQNGQDCLMPAGGADPRDAFRLVGIRSIDGVEAWDLASQRGAGLAYAPGVPYPVWLGLGGAFAQLVSFERGAEVELSAPRVAALELPLPNATRHVWGPDETGVKVEFPLSEAFERMQEDVQFTALAEYLDDHPSAAVYQADFSHMLQGHEAEQRHRYIWQFSLFADGERFHGCVTKAVTVQPWAGDLQGVLSESTGTEYRFANDDTCGDTLMGDGFPESSDLPDEMPSLAAAWAVYDEYVQAIEPNGWSFIFHCGDDCLEPQLSFTIRGGLQDHQSAALPGIDPVPPSRPETSMSELWGLHFKDGAPSGIYGSTKFEDESAPPNGAAPPPTSGGPLANAAAPLPKHWQTVAAGTSVAAFAGAVLYLVWPAIKSGVAVPLFSRVRKDRVLDHPHRVMLVDLVTAEPGIHFARIAERAGIARGTVRHHLNVLVAQGTLQAKRGPRYTSYFLQWTDRRVIAAVDVLRADVARRALALAAAEPGISPSDVARRLGVSRQAVSKQVAKLEEADLICKRPGANRFCLEATGHGLQALAT